MSKDLDMWRIANKAWFHHDNPTSFALTQLSSVIPNFLLLVRLQPVKQILKIALVLGLWGMFSG